MRISSTFSLDSHGLRFSCGCKNLFKMNFLAGRRGVKAKKGLQKFPKLYSKTNAKYFINLQFDQVIQVIKIDSKTTSKHLGGKIKTTDLRNTQTSLVSLHNCRTSFCKKKLSVRENAQSSRTRKDTRCSLKV